MEAKQYNFKSEVWKNGVSSFLQKKKKKAKGFSLIKYKKNMSNEISRKFQWFSFSDEIMIISELFQIIIYCFGFIYFSEQGRKTTLCSLELFPRVTHASLCAEPVTDKYKQRGQAWKLLPGQLLQRWLSKGGWRSIAAGYSCGPGPNESPRS